MTASIIWLVRFGIDQQIFSLKDAWLARIKLGEDAELLDFAQYFVDCGVVTESAIEQLENIASRALSQSEKGPPLDDPFAPSGTDTASPLAPVLSRMGQTSAPAATLFSSGMCVDSSSHSAFPSASTSVCASDGDDPLASVEQFPFDRVAAFSDAQLARSFRGLLQACAREGVSDLHLSAGALAFVRRKRALSPISRVPLAAADALRLNTVLLAPHQRELFLERKDFDFALALDTANRYRVNLMFHKGGAAGSYRIVAAKIPKLDALGLRNLDSVRKLLSYHNGLILVTGPVGAGKTTTLAAMVAELNEKRSDHIITVEDPIEVVQVSQGCAVTQREVGPHTCSFASALKGALREDPDVIVIGELRDLETIEMAISASETGHLVIGTMHTSDASTTLNRLLDVFPPAQQTQIRASVAESLRGVVCQRLLPGVDGGLVLACEILIGNPAVSALIRDGKISGLRNVLETGQRDGMCLMESSVFALYQSKMITAETARANISNRLIRGRIS
jgi:twitching motility protein PilT